MFSFLTLEHKKLPSWLICWKTDPGLNKISSILCALSLVTAMQISLLPHTSTGIVVLSSMILSTACLSWKKSKFCTKYYFTNKQQTKSSIRTTRKILGLNHQILSQKVNSWLNEIENFQFTKLPLLTRQSSSEKFTTLTFRITIIKFYIFHRTFTFCNF